MSKLKKRILSALGNVDRWNPAPTDNLWDIPTIKACMVTPEYLVGFNFLLSRKGSLSKWLHCFLHDYQIQRLWNNPDHYIDAIKRQGYGGILSPDFSLFMDMPLALQLYNTYRNRWVGAYMQMHGIKVVPTVSWSGSASYDFCFLGIEPHSTVAISTVGINTPDVVSGFFDGYAAMMERLEPRNVLIYGRKLDGLQGTYYQPFYKALEQVKPRLIPPHRIVRASTRRTVSI